MRSLSSAPAQITARPAISAIRGSLLPADSLLFSLTRALDVAIVEDDDEYKIVVVGVATTPEVLDPDDEDIVISPEEEDFAVARYNSDGSLDTSFDGDGKVRIDFGDATIPSEDENDKAAGIVISDNDYIIAGHAFNAGTTGEDFAVIVIDGEDEGN